MKCNIVKNLSASSKLDFDKGKLTKFGKQTNMTSLKISRIKTDLM